MLESIGTVIMAVMKVGVPIYVAALIASSLMLFLPDAVAQQIGIEQFRHLYRGYLGGVLVASISLLAAYGLSATSRAVNNRLDDRRLRRLTLDTLRTLTTEEKQFLRPFIIEGRNTSQADISNGVVGGLVAKRILFRSSSVGSLISGFPYNLQPMARIVLNDKPQLLN